MDNSCIQEMVFDARVRSYITGRNNYDNNPFASPIFEMLDTSIRFDLIGSVLEIALGNAQVIPEESMVQDGMGTSLEIR